MRGNLLVFTMGDLLRQFSMFITFPYFSLYVAALGGNMIDIGIVNGLRPLLGLFIYPIAGYISDRYSRVKIASITVFIGAILWGSLGLAPDWRWVALGNFLLGTLTFYFPAANSLMADSLPPDKRGLGFSLWLVIPRAAGIFSPFIGGYLITVWGVETAMRVLFALTFVISTLIAVMNYKYLSEPERLTVQEDKRTLSQVIVESYRDIFDIIKGFPSNLRAYALMLALGFMFNNMVSSYWVIYAIDVMGLTELNWGIVLLVSSLVNVILLVPGGMLVDRVGATRVMKISLTVAAIPTILFPVFHELNMLIIIIAVISIANSFLMSAAPSYMAQAVPTERRGRVMSAIGQGMLFVNLMGGGGGGPGMGALLTIPSIIGAVLGGFIYNYNPTHLWTFLGASMLINAVICHLYLGKQ